MAVLVAGTMRLSGFHLLSYYKNTTNANGIDLVANVDAEFSQRNSHYLFSEQYYLLAAGIMGADVTEANLLSPTLNAISKFNIWPINASDTNASPPRMDYWTKFPVPLPMNEELQFQVNSSGTDTVGATGLLVIGVQGWNNSQPQGIPPLPMFEMRFSCTPTLNSGAWSTLVAPVFEQSLRGGTYAVCGMEVQGTNLIAARIVFPQAMIYRGRRLRPGWVASNALGDLTATVGEIGPFFLGQWGQFTTAELPNIECLGVGTGTPTVVGIMRLARLSESININYGSQTYANQ